MTAWLCGSVSGCQAGIPLPARAGGEEQSGTTPRDRAEGWDVTSQPRDLLFILQNGGIGGHSHPCLPSLPKSTARAGSWDGLVDGICQRRLRSSAGFCDTPGTLLPFLTARCWTPNFRASVQSKVRPAQVMNISAEVREESVGNLGISLGSPGVVLVGIHPQGTMA